jgi:hypothetical protein
MGVDHLAHALRDAYAKAPKGDKAVTIHLFGIRHARELDGQNLHKLAERAGISDTYGTELRKGVRLAEYVILK